jgi:A nuclease of the HNH/ENDO VII superfamily with conserved LHH
VVAERGLAKGAAARNPGAQFSEKAYAREIDTGAVNKDAKALLDESGQGNATKADRNARKGEEAAAARAKKWKEKEVNGRKVYQRDDLFDPLAKDAKGRTNLELMKSGKAPIGYDGKPINLHHVTQTEPGPMAELLQTTHKENSNLLHMYRNQYDKSWRDVDGTRRKYNSAPDPIDRGAFDKWKENYWKLRALDFN